MKNGAFSFLYGASELARRHAFLLDEEFAELRLRRESQRVRYGLYRQSRGLEHRHSLLHYVIRYCLLRGDAHDLVGHLREVSGADGQLVGIECDVVRILVVLCDEVEKRVVYIRRPEFSVVVSRLYDLAVHIGVGCGHGAFHVVAHGESGGYGC